MSKKYRFDISALHKQIIQKCWYKHCGHIISKIKAKVKNLIFLLALGHSSLLLPQTHGLGLLAGGLGHSGYSGYSGLLASPLALGGHGLALNAQPIVLGHLGHGLAAPAFGGLGKFWNFYKYILKQKK